MDNKQNRSKEFSKANLLLKSSQTGRPFNPQLLLHTHEPIPKTNQLKMMDSMSFSIDKQCLGSSKSSAICTFLCNDPITHNDPSNHSTANTKQDQPVRNFGVKNRYVTYQKDSSPSFITSTEGFGLKPSSVGKTSSEPSTSQFIEMKVKCKQLEFECCSLRDTIKQYRARESNGDEWRMNKLNQSHQKLSELSQQVQIMTLEMHSLQDNKTRLQSEVARLKQQLAELQTLNQQRQSTISHQQSVQKQTIEKLKADHKQQVFIDQTEISRHGTRQQSITSELETLKIKYTSVSQQCENQRKQVTQLKADLAEKQMQISKITEDNSVVVRKIQLELEGYQNDANQLKSANVLAQAKLANQHRALKSDYEGMLAIFQIKENNIEELKTRIKSQDKHYQQQTSRLKQAYSEIQNKFKVLKKDQAYEAGISEKNIMMQHHQMQYAFHQMTGIIQQLKIDNKLLHEQNMNMEKEFTVAITKIETLQRSNSQKIDEVKNLQAERTNLLDRLQQVSISSKVLHDGGSELTRRFTPHRPVVKCTSHFKERLLTQHQPELVSNILARRKSMKLKSNSMSKLRQCDSAQQSQTYVSIQRRFTPLKQYYEPQQEQSLNEAILRRCQVIIAEGRLNS